MGAHTCILTWPKIEKKRTVLPFRLHSHRKKMFMRGVYSCESEKGGVEEQERKLHTAHL